MVLKLAYSAGQLSADSSSTEMLYCLNRVCVRSYPIISFDQLWQLSDNYNLQWIDNTHYDGYAISVDCL